MDEPSVFHQQDTGSTAKPSPQQTSSQPPSPHVTQSKPTVVSAMVTTAPAASPKARLAEEDDERRFVSEFGFEIDEKEKEREEVYVKGVDGKQVLRREIKWANMTRSWAATSTGMYDKLKERCRKGIPTKLRAVAWQLLLKSRTEMENPANRGVYAVLKRKKLDADVACVIERDLGRTFPTHVLFRDQDGAGQTKLRSILHAYACIDPEVGYVQGMGFIVGTLLTQMEEEECFWALHAMMNGELYRLRDMFKPGFPMLQIFFYQLKQLMRELVRSLYDRFEAISVDVSFYASQWFLTLFVYHFQFRALLRIWDIFLCEGWKEIFRVAIALMKWEEKTLVALPFDQVLPRLKTLHEDKNPDEILARSLQVKFTTAQLLKWRQEYEASHAA